MICSSSKQTLHNKPKRVEAKRMYTPRPPISEKMLEAHRRIEAMQKAARNQRIVAREDDVDRDILAAIEKADCVARSHDRGLSVN